MSRSVIEYDQLLTKWVGLSNQTLATVCTTTERFENRSLTSNMASSGSPSKVTEPEYDELDDFDSDDDDPNVFKIRGCLGEGKGVIYTTKQLHGSFREVSNATRAIANFIHA